MKKTIRTIALIAVLGMAATGCQKEQMMETMVVVTNDESYLRITYMVDGECCLATFDSDEEWQAFLNRLFGWAEEGRSVCFCNAGATTSAKQNREIVTYTTRDESDAFLWADNMRKDGYKVYISFDSETGVYTCTAIK